MTIADGTEDVAFIPVILTSNSCVGDAIKVWNQTPNDIKKCELLSQLKKAARSYAKTLPT